ncbi:macrophage mannose receptor 1-like [Mya arenaria]|uniref:macrophage mannose receptor 1-like n=1 Tax=Mya arenaria TaxID=6604 RepID=UPI0022E93DD0|nr:macrophage mannose receptor 1-like [Mya arenaria]
MITTVSSISSHSNTTSSIFNTTHSVTDSISTTMPSAVTPNATSVMTQPYTSDTQSIDSFTSMVSTSSSTTQSSTSAATTRTAATTTMGTTTLLPSTVFTTAPPTLFSLPGDTSLCSSDLASFASISSGSLGQFGSSCYVVSSRLEHWASAERTCNTHGGHLVHVGSQAENDYLIAFLNKYYNHHSVWIGLHDEQTEGNFVWTSGDPLTFQNWAPTNEMTIVHGIEDCVVMDTRTLTGHWDDRDCSFELNGYICQFGTTSSPLQSTTPNVFPTVVFAAGDGDTDQCPSNVRAHALSNGGVLAQYERACFELLPTTRYSWEHAENVCNNNGGHLAHISSQEEQNFVQSFINRHFPLHAVWIGLNDVHNEGTFTWTSGTSVRYTNWMPGHVSNTLGGSGFEDCTVLVPYREGQWDDVHCGYEAIFGHDSGEVHYAFCRYKIHSQGASIVG